MTTERSEATQAQQSKQLQREKDRQEWKKLIHVDEKGNVMLGRFKKAIGTIVDSPFASGHKLFCPTDECMMNRDMLLAIADVMGE
jgi:hypothetical protein